MGSVQFCVALLSLSYLPGVGESWSPSGHCYRWEQNTGSVESCGLLLSFWCLPSLGHRVVTVKRENKIWRLSSPAGPASYFCSSVMYAMVEEPLSFFLNYRYRWEQSMGSDESWVAFLFWSYLSRVYESWSSSDYCYRWEHSLCSVESQWTNKCVMCLISVLLLLFCYLLRGERVLISSEKRYRWEQSMGSVESCQSCLVLLLLLFLLLFFLLPAESWSSNGYRNRWEQTDLGSVTVKLV